MKGLLLYMYRSMLPSILLVLAAGWNVGCSSDDDDVPETIVPDNMTEAIVFGGTMSEMPDYTPRPASLKDETSSFHLWGFKTMTYDDNGTVGDESDDIYGNHQQVFPGYTLIYNNLLVGSSTENQSGWYYVGNINGMEQTIKYWDYAAKSYRFFGVTGNKADITYSEATDAGGALWANLTFNVNAGSPVYVSDLWFSNNGTGMPAYGQTVTLKFRHPFCQVRFMFVDEEGNPLDAMSSVVPHITPGSLKFRPTDTTKKIAYGGGITMSYPITGTQRVENATIVPSDTEVYNAFTIPYEDQTDVNNYAFVENQADNKKWYTALPNSSQGTYTMSLTYNGVERASVVPASYMQWRLGYRYTYVFKLGDKGLTFQPDLFVYTQWQAGYTSDIPVKW